MGAVKKLFGAGGNGAVVQAQQQAKQQARLSKEKEALQAQAARRTAAQQRVRTGQTGFRSLLTGGFGGIQNETKKKLLG